MNSLPRKVGITLLGAVVAAFILMVLRVGFWAASVMSVPFPPDFVITGLKWLVAIGFPVLLGGLAIRFFYELGKGGLDLWQDVRRSWKMYKELYSDLKKD